MSSASEVVQAFKVLRRIQVDKNIFLPVTGSSRGYVHLGERRAGVVYEVWCRRNVAFAQLRGSLESELHAVLTKHIPSGMHVENTKKEFGIHGGKDVSFKGSTDSIVKQLSEQVADLYKTFEKKVSKFQSVCGARKVPHSATRNEGDEPWYVGWQCDDKCLDKSYDKEFRKLKKSAGLTWLPWVGKEYRNEKILVIGESNYTDKGWTSTVDKDIMYTRKVVDHICFRRMHRQSQTLPNIARMLNVFKGGKLDIVPMVWPKIAFVDVCQRCLEQVGKKRERPSEEDIVNGWRTIFALIRILKPRFLIFMGKSAADFLSDEVQGMQVNCPIACSRKNDSRHKHAIIRTGNMQIPMILLPHPSNGFSHNDWRQYLRETFPSDPYFRRLVD